jgi:hypothetical protein
MSDRKQRIPLVVAGAVAAILALALAIGGGAALVVDGEKDADGYLNTSSERFASGSTALVSDNLDLDGVGSVADEFGKVRLSVESAASSPVFVGVARTEDVRRYLGGASYTTLTDVEFDPFRADYRRHDGAARATPPADSRIWDESSSGTGRRSLEWKVRDGDWSVVIMNADGSQGVAADVKAGAELPWLDEVGLGALGAALLLAAGAVALIVVGLGRPGGPRPTATPATSAA